MAAAENTSAIPGINDDDALFLRWPGVTSESKIAALEAVASGGGVAAAAEAARVHGATIVHWRNRDEAFAECWKAAWKAGVKPYEARLHERAMAGPEDSWSGQALSKVLAARDRTNYGEQQKTVHDGGVKVESVIVTHAPPANPPPLPTEEK